MNDNHETLFQELNELKESILDAQERIEFLKDLIAENKEAMLNKTIEYTNQLGYEECLHLIDTVYWSYQGFVHSIKLSTHRKMRGGKGIFNERTVTKTCVECLQVFDVSANTHSQYKALTEKQYTCPTCEETLIAIAKEHRSALSNFQAEYTLALRTMPYREYLKTEHWHEVRRKALRRASYRCQMCGADKSLHVHHNTYKNRGHEEPSDVIALCADCHAKFHDKLGGE